MCSVLLRTYHWRWGVSILTSAGVILDQKLIQSSPASSHPDHQRATQDTDHPQLLGISKLQQTHKIHIASLSFWSTRWWTAFPRCYRGPMFCPVTQVIYVKSKQPRNIKHITSCVAIGNQRAKCNSCFTIFLIFVFKNDSPCIYWHLFAPLGTSWDSYTVIPVDSPKEGKVSSKYNRKCHKKYTTLMNQTTFMCFFPCAHTVHTSSLIWSASSVLL